MPIEIERKYLLRNDDWRLNANQGTDYEQGYIIGSDKASVRIRIERSTAMLNIKSATLGIKRQEYEYEIPVDEAQELLSSLCAVPLVKKTRYIVIENDDKWEIDVFSGDNTGLVMAEIELQSEDQSIELPSWCGQEVSDDPRYYNVNLVKHPYSTW